MDLEHYATDMLAIARANLERDGDLMPIVFLLTGGGKVIAIGLADLGPTVETKRATYAAVSRMAALERAVAAITINDTWMVKADATLSREEVDRVRPSEHPNRVEGLVASIILPDGSLSGMISQTYHREEGGIRWDPAEQLPNLGGESSQQLLPPWGVAEGPVQ